MRTEGVSDSDPAPPLIKHRWERALTINAAASLDVSVVIPAKDERDTLLRLYEQICASLEPLGKTFEVIFIDDGGSDGSFAVMRELHEKDPRVRALRFRVNLGKSPALAAGFAACKGNVILTIDADLQDDPSEIPSLLKKLDEGYDLVSGWKQNRRDPFSKRLLSKIFNFVVSRASRIPLHDFNCGLKAYRREVLEKLQLYGEMHRFVPIIAGWYGFRITEIPVTHYPRRSGRSKYGNERLLRGLLDFSTVMFFTRFVQRPSHLFGRIGISFGFLGTILFLAGLVLIRYGIPVMGGTVMAAGVFLGLMGFQAFFLGLMAEMLTFFHRREEPSYFINERLD